MAAWTLLVLSIACFLARAQYIVTTIGGTPKQCGYAAGPLTSALLNNPNGIATWSPGVWLIADFYNTVVRNLSSASLTIAAGTAQSNICPTFPDEEGISATSAHFSRPVGVAVDGVGGFAVSDSSCGTVRRVSSSGTISTIAS